MDANISINEQMELFRICAAILHIGNLKFKALRVANEDGSDIENEDGLLLKLDGFILLFKLIVLCCYCN